MLITALVAAVLILLHAKEGPRNDDSANVQKALSATDTHDNLSSRPDSNAIVDQVEKNVFNATSLNIVVRPREHLDLREYQLSYDELVPMAEAGDSKAAFALFQRLSFCQTAIPPQSAAEHQADLDRIEQTFQVPVYRDGEVFWGSIKNPRPEQIQHAKMATKRRYELCNTLSMVQRDEANHWLQSSINNGATWYEVVSAYANTLGEDDQEKIYQSAWDSGDPRALLDLARLQKTRYESGDKPDGNVEAYAYLLAFNVINQAVALENPAIPTTFGIGPETQAAMERHQLLPRQVAEAEKMAEELISGNNNCCFEIVGRPPTH